MNIYTVIDAVRRATEGPCVYYTDAHTGAMVVRPLVWVKGKGTVTFVSKPTPRQRIQFTVTQP